MPPRERLTMLRVVGVLAVVEVLIRWVSLPRLSRLLGVHVNLGPSRTDVDPLPVTALPEQARRQLRCTWKVADAWPLSRGPCLRRALVGGHLLRDLEPSVRLGVTGSGDEVLAHAWLEIDGRPLEPVARFSPFQHRPSEDLR
jgi:Transglutaminase-like superfamily